MLIPDPIGNDRGYTLILACFIEQLMHDHNSQSTTVCGYIRSINILFQLRNCTIPADLSDNENICSKIIKSRKQEEDIARQRSPITNEIFAYLLNRNRDNALQDSFEAAVTDFMINQRKISSTTRLYLSDDTVDPNAITLAFYFESKHTNSKNHVTAV